MARRQTFRSVVTLEDCDKLGHMNISRYVAACSEAVFDLLAQVGMDDADITSGRRMSFAAVHMECSYRAELHEGDAYHMISRIERIGGRSIGFYHRMIRERDGVEAFDCKVTNVIMSLVSRKSVQIPDDLRADLEAWEASAA